MLISSEIKWQQKSKQFNSIILLSLACLSIEKILGSATTLGQWLPY